MKNWMLGVLARLLRRFAPTPDPNHFLVVATTALGDTLWATPALQALRAGHPTARIVVLTSPVGEEVLRHNPWSDAIYVLREPMLRHFGTLWRKLCKERPATVVILHASQRLVIPLCVAVGAKRIVASSGRNKGLDRWLTDPVALRAEHEIVRRLRLVELVGGKRGGETLSFFLQPEEKSSEPGVVVLHPGAKDPFRRWLGFRALREKLEWHGHKVVVTGSRAEAALLAEVGGRTLVPGSLRELAALVAEAKLVVTNDTGPAHLACALGAPLIMLFGCTDPQLFGPHQARNAHVIAKRPTCDPCLKRKCRRAFCQLQISPEEVFNLSMKVLDHATP